MKTRQVILSLCLIMLSAASSAAEVSSAFHTQLYKLINEYRESKGLTQLPVDEALAVLGAEYASLIDFHGVFSHNLLSEDDFAELCRRCKVIHYDLVHENFQRGRAENMTAEFVLQRFLDSPTHRASIEKDDAVAMGAGRWKQYSGEIILVLYIGARY